jgi:16S rRNA C1402 N4-methylase RsmH
MTENVTHTPVLLNEIVEFLKPPTGSCFPYVIYDGTLGGAGHAQALLLSDASVFLLGVDRDSWALERARELLGELSARVHLVHGVFSDLAKHLQSLPQSIKDHSEVGATTLPSDSGRSRGIELSVRLAGARLFISQ